MQTKQIYHVIWPPVNNYAFTCYTHSSQRVTHLWKIGRADQLDPEGLRAQLTMEFLIEGQHVASVSLANFKPGNYENAARSKVPFSP